MSQFREFPSDELHELLEAVCLGELTDAQAARLEQLVTEDEDARRHYVRYLTMHALAERFEGHDARHEARQLAAQFYAHESQQNSRHVALAKLHDFFTRPTPFSVTVAALVIGLLVISMAFMAPPFYRAMVKRDDAPAADPYRIVAEVTALHEVKWAEGKVGLHRGAFLVPGRQLEIEYGVVEVTFRGGARVVIEGPAVFTLDDEMTGQLTTGGVTAYAPPEAHGFAITTPSARVVDLGTEFGIEVFTDNATEVVVLHGEVECFARDQNGNEKESVRLTEGQGASVASVGRQVVKHEKIDVQVIAAHRQRAQPIDARRNVLRVNFDDAAMPQRARLPAGYQSYAASDGGGPLRQFVSPLASDGDIGVQVVSPFFRNANQDNYGDVTALHSSGSPLAGYNALVNSGALVNHENGGPIIVQLKDLKAGKYRIRFFLHGTHRRPGANADQGRWNISGSANASDVSGSFGCNQPASETSGIPPTNLASIGQIDLPLTIAHDGDDATFRFDAAALAGNLQLWVNGFELRGLSPPDDKGPPNNETVVP